MAAVGLDTSQTASQDSGYLSVGPSHGPNLSLPTPQHPARRPQRPARRPRRPARRPRRPARRPRRPARRPRRPARPQSGPSQRTE